MLKTQLLRFLLHIRGLMELHIALDLAGFEVLGSDGEVGVDGLPVASIRWVVGLAGVAGRRQG